MKTVKTVNVILAHKLEEVFKRRIAELDRRVKVRDLSDLLRKELRWTDQAKLSGEEREKFYGLLRDAEVLLLPRPPRKLPPDAPKVSDVLSRSSALRWVHYVGAGLNYFNEMGLWELKATVTNSSGVAAVPIAEHVLHIMLIFARKAMVNFTNKANKRWERILSFELRGKTLGIIGLGHIGRECARLSKALGMRVIITRRSAVPNSALPNVDQVYPRKDLLEMLVECDFVLLSLPLTQETYKIIGAAELRAMKPSAYLINIARGGLIDEPALIQALEEGWIAGAGLDVFVKEPLPPDNRLWELPNTIITCHDSNFTGMADARIVELFCANLEKYLTQQPLLNVVDKEKGY
jgi:D-2-hydroxyacid dehydrogenase (NADP+)